MQEYSGHQSNVSNSQQNPQKKNSLQFEMIKKNLLYDALIYNKKQEQIKNKRKKDEKQKQLNYFYNVNRRVSTQAQYQRSLQRQKKEQLKRLLAEEYEKQISQQKKNKIQQAHRNRSYGAIEEQTQNDYYERRAKQLARHYGKQPVTSFNPADVNPEIQNNLKKFKPFQISPQQRMETEKPQNLNYKDYLHNEIDRRRKIKEDEKLRQKERQKEMVKRMQSDYQKQQEEQRYFVRQQKLNFRKGLDSQVSYKRGYPYT